MTLTLPDPALILLMGAPASGKTTFAQRHFALNEVLSPDCGRCPAGAVETATAFDLLHHLVERRLSHRQLVVVDAHHLHQLKGRQPLINLGKRYHLPLIALCFDTPLEWCLERNRQRAHPQSEGHIRQLVQQQASLWQKLPGEGVNRVIRLAADGIDHMEVVRQPLACDRRDWRGPFDIIGDVHGCATELAELLLKLGYTIDGDRITAPPGRKALFLGDLVDRGPGNMQVLRWVMDMVERQQALSLLGNHEAKLLRAMQGRASFVGAAVQQTLNELWAEPPAFMQAVQRFIESLPHHLVLDQERLVIAHAGLKLRYHGRDSAAVRGFALYGEVMGGQLDEEGYPIRRDWAARYRGRAMVVYGHTVVKTPQWRHNTLCIDTGCVFGGQLTALRYPEKTLVNVAAHDCYWSDDDDDAP